MKWLTVLCVVLASSSGLAEAPKPTSVRANPRWQQARPLDRAHLTALQSYRLTVDVGCAVHGVLTKLRASTDPAVAAELKAWEQAWVELGSKQFPDPAFAELNKRFPQLALALEQESLTFRDLVFTLAQLRLGAATLANLKVGAKPPFPGDVTGAAEYLFTWGDGLQACGLWKRDAAPR